MKNNNCCPICGRQYPDENDRNKKYVRSKKSCTKKNMKDGYLYYHCEFFDFDFLVKENIVCMTDIELKEKLFDLMVEHMLHQKNCVVKCSSRDWCFYFDDICENEVSGYPEKVNLANAINNYPTQVIDVASRTLMNYSLKYPHYGDVICPSWQEKRMSFSREANSAHTCGVMRILEDLEYVKDPEQNDCYVITALGWQKINEFQKEEQIVQQAFIAMSFRKETNDIRAAFKLAIQKSGYSFAIIDEKEHNNQIVPEIFFEIERSKFVVVDVTYPNYGAYYEAGYAQALGKQVIVCCKKDVFENKQGKYECPHFDISQKSMIIWDNIEDLNDRLIRRIKATVG